MLGKSIIFLCLQCLKLSYFPTIFLDTVTIVHFLTLLFGSLFISETICYQHWMELRYWREWRFLFSLLIDFCPFIVLRIVKPAGFEPLEMADNWLKFFSRFLIWVSMTLKGQDLNLLRIAKPCRFVLWSFLSSVMSLPWNKFLNIYQFCSNCILLETKLHLLEASQSFPIWR